MNRYIALLRAVNVGGTGKLPMTDLRDMCAGIGFENVQTYIASGNVVLSSELDAAGVKAALEERLEAYAGKPVGVMVRTGPEMARIAAGNPFPEAPGNRVAVLFLDGAPDPADIENPAHQADEVIWPGEREIYIHYPSGQGRSKLHLKAFRTGTVRNLNTVVKLAEMAK